MRMMIAALSGSGAIVLLPSCPTTLRWWASEGRFRNHMKTRDERREEMKRLAATPNGINKLYLILTRNFIPFKKLPIGTLMIEAILDHEYSGKK